MRPNGCWENKKAQLELHLRFLQAYRTNRLRKGNYFYYLDHRRIENQSCVKMFGGEKL